MTSKRHSTANQTKVARVRTACEELFEQVLREGFHGVAKLELVIADGTIQTICRAVEQIDKRN